MNKIFTIKYYWMLLIIIYVGTAFGQNNNNNYHAIVNATFSGEDGSIIDGKPTFASIGSALNSVPDNNKFPFKIFIQKGRYYEKLIVEKANVCLIGESRDKTIVTFDATGDTPKPGGGRYGTWGCATLEITAPDFRAENLTIENGFDYPANAAKPDEDPTKIYNMQAVALMTSTNNDRAVFYNCKLTGYQDTMFANTGRHFFYKCRIEGHVDFIFGAGQVVFENCEIVSRNRKKKNPTGYITAPSTLIDYPYGFMFTDCRFVKENSEVPKGSVRLGRPWHPDGDLRLSGSAVFMNCFMDDHIGVKGYARISARDSSGQKIWFDWKPDSRFFEYKTYGPGAINSPNRPMLDDKAAKWYTIAHVLDDWIPDINR